MSKILDGECSAMVQSPKTPTFCACLIPVPIHFAESALINSIIHLICADPGELARMVDFFFQLIQNSILGTFVGEINPFRKILFT